jgi:rhodanese-related sulfurtransferase
MIMWGVVALLGVVIAVLALRPASGGTENVDAAGAKAAIAAGAQIIDVRTAGEYQMGHIAGAVNVPVDQVATSAQGWDRDATYVVYCAVGDRSVTAVQTMESMGFNNIKHLSAGVVAWDEPLEQGAATASSTIETNGKPVMIEFFTDS